MSNYAGIIKDDFNNGKGVGLTIFLQGCTHHCKNCQNKETWDFNGGKPFTDDLLDELIDYTKKHSYITRLTLSGGDPLDNKETTLKIINKFRKEIPSINIWLYTGYLYENIDKDLIKDVDILVDGPYIDSLRDVTLYFKGSSNQRVIDVKKSLKTSQVIRVKEDV